MTDVRHYDEASARHTAVKVISMEFYLGLGISIPVGNESTDGVYILEGAGHSGTEKSLPPFVICSICSLSRQEHLPL